MEPSSQTPRPIPEEVENQRHFNELRGELLNAREKVVDRWLTTVAAILTAFTLIAGFVGYLSFESINDVIAETREHAAQVREQATQAEKIVENIRKTSETAQRELNVEGQTIAQSDTQPRSEPPQGPFGKWESRNPNLVYQANSDGFIAAYTAGNSPAQDLMIYTGRKQDSLFLRTRAGRYDGTVCPVPKGHFWTVKGGSGGLAVHWLPVSSPGTDGQS